MLVDVVLERAKSVLGQSTVYKLGKGNFSNANPQRPLGSEADCSGFVCWCLMRNRKTDHPFYVNINQGWLDTLAIHKDIDSSVGYFDKLSKPTPGAIVVYPDKDGNEGHIGIIVEGSGSGVSGISKVIHCSSGNYKQTGDAIQITGTAIWKNRSDSLIGWYSGLES